MSRTNRAGQPKAQKKVVKVRRPRAPGYVPSKPDNKRKPAAPAAERPAKRARVDDEEDDDEEVRVQPHVDMQEESEEHRQDHSAAEGEEEEEVYPLQKDMNNAQKIFEDIANVANSSGQALPRANRRKLGDSKATDNDDESVEKGEKSMEKGKGKAAWAWFDKEKHWQRD